jgi:SAM-dependent methyltransferase
MPELTRELIAELRKNGPTDPVLMYRDPWVGRLFRERINLGLRMLEGRMFHSVLEVGFASGAVLVTIAANARKLTGLDLDAEHAPVHSLLRSRGYKADLYTGSIYEMPFESEAFDLAISFSVFEHLHDPRRGLSEVTRVLRPGGLFLLGMPAVNLMMRAGFRAIGYKRIEDHHVTSPRVVASSFERVGLRVVRTSHLVFPVRPITLYYNWLLTRL